MIPNISLLLQKVLHVSLCSGREAISMKGRLLGPICHWTPSSAMLIPGSLTHRAHFVIHRGCEFASGAQATPTSHAITFIQQGEKNEELITYRVPYSSYTHSWCFARGTQAGPSYESHLWVPVRICPQIFNQLLGLLGMETRTFIISILIATGIFLHGSSGRLLRIPMSKSDWQLKSIAGVGIWILQCMGNLWELQHKQDCNNTIWLYPPRRSPAWFSDLTKRQDFLFPLHEMECIWRRQQAHCSK